MKRYWIITAFALLFAGCGQSPNAANNNDRGSTGSQKLVDEKKKEGQEKSTNDQFEDIAAQGKAYEDKIHDQVLQWCEKHNISQEEFMALGRAWSFRTAEVPIAGSFASALYHESFLKELSGMNLDEIRAKFPPVKEPEWYHASLAKFDPDWRSISCEELIIKIQVLLPYDAKVWKLEGEVEFKENGKSLYKKPVTDSTGGETQVTIIDVYISTEDAGANFNTLKSSDNLEVAFHVSRVVFDGFVVWDRKTGVRTKPPVDKPDSKPATTDGATTPFAIAAKFAARQLSVGQTFRIEGALRYVEFYEAMNFESGIGRGININMKFPVLPEELKGWPAGRFACIEGTISEIGSYMVNFEDCKVISIGPTFADEIHLAADLAHAFSLRNADQPFGPVAKYGAVGSPPIRRKIKGGVDSVTEDGIVPRGTDKILVQFNGDAKNEAEWSALVPGQIATLEASYSIFNTPIEIRERGFVIYEQAIVVDKVPSKN